MSNAHTFIIAALGGFAGALGLVLLLITAVIAYVTIGGLLNRLEQRRVRRDLKACQAIDALGTTDKPDHP
ncbi:hypothetical protein AB0M87_04685 [Streptomyces sp. NPDC051320]|uniref:hypothetical protein n=1 Tax=Streptomyces sp. NPDC051320 TaxID=3154644 RepID=UPI0034164172